MNQELERMSLSYEIQDGFERGCGIAPAPVIGGKGEQIEGCEASSPCPS